MRKNKHRGQATTLVGVLIAVGVIVALIVSFMSLNSINAGNVGIKFDKSRHTVDPQPVEYGWVWINPFSQTLTEYPITVQSYDMVQADKDTGGDDSIKVQSSEGQQLNLDVVVQFQVKRDDAAKLYLDWGGAPIETVQDRVVRGYTRSLVPALAASQGWEKILSGRTELEASVSDELQKEFNARHLTLVSFNIREVHLPAKLQEALDAKINSQQQSEQQRYKLDQAKIQAEQRVVEAQAEAQARKAQADGEAQAITTLAKAQADANRQIAQSVTAELNQYRQIEKWDGKLPTVSGSASPIVDLRSTGVVSPTN